MTFRLDKGATDRARVLVREALGILMRGISPVGQPRDRADIAICEIAGILYDEAEVAELGANLRALLSSLHIGTEPELDPDLLEVFDRRAPNVHRCPDETQ